jgi:hypothetical protein
VAGLLLFDDLADVRVEAPRSPRRGEHRLLCRHAAAISECVQHRAVVGGTGVYGRLAPSVQAIAGPGRLSGAATAYRSANQ